MSNFRKFNEYLNAKGTVQTKPEVDPKADTGPDAAKKPETPATKGKNWKAEVPLAGAPKDYTSSDKPWKPKKAETGLSDKGDKKLVYEPKTPIDPEGKKVKTWPKVTTEEFLANTREMSLAQFTKFISEQNKTVAENLPPCSCDPVQAARYVVALANANEHIMETVVREIKRSGCFDKLVNEVFTHQEAFVEMALMMADEENGIKNARRLVRALHEVTDAPAAETEGPIKKPAAAKARHTKSISGEKLDMGSNDVVQTRAVTRPEHNLINALLGNKRLLESVLDGTSGYDTPLSDAAKRVIQMCQHYFQGLSDEQLGKIGDMIQQFAVSNRGPTQPQQPAVQ